MYLFNKHTCTYIVQIQSEQELPNKYLDMTKTNVRGKPTIEMEITLLCYLLFMNSKLRLNSTSGYTKNFVIYLVI